MTTTTNEDTRVKSARNHGYGYGAAFRAETSAADWAEIVKTESILDDAIDACSEAGFTDPDADTTDAFIAGFLAGCGAK